MELPFISVIICTYNRGEMIKDCLGALIYQDYPKDRYEIIVVDDCSQDETEKIIKYYRVKYIRHEKNLGVAISRNTGLKNSRGEIIAFCEDDCIPLENWLQSLIMSYEEKNIVAVGGLIVPYRKETLTEVYMDEIGYGRPSPLEFAKSNNPFYRIYIYIRKMYKPMIDFEKEKIEVYEIYAANSSFRREILEELNGWDEKFRFGADTDICIRIHKKFPEKKIIFAKNAIVLHRHITSFKIFLKQNYIRGEAIAKNHYKHPRNKIPPLFPFPFFAFLFFFYFLINIKFFEAILMTMIILGLFYFHWIFKFFNEKRFYFLLFPLFQFLFEFFSNLGTIRGLLKYRNLF